MKTFKWWFLFLPFISVMAEAQFTYTFENNVSVIEEERTLVQPFTGGFIAPQYSSIDLNLDGIKDLFVFDRASNKVFTYLFQQGEYIYAPYYESLFPDGLKNWVLLRDYNCDGKMDLFTSSIFGMSLFKNTGTSELKWELIHQTIYTEGSNGQTNLQVSGLDLPAITDVDNDGDLDILNFNFATGGGIEFHKNFSFENTGACGLELKRVTRRYGDFEECTCDTYIFGTDDCFNGGRLAHTGGKTILSFAYAAHPLQDLLIGQEYCDFPGYLPNTGTAASAKMETVSLDFPFSGNPLRMDFPAFYEIDLFNDDTKDLLSAPNKYQTDGLKNYRKLSYLYTKNSNGNYDFITDEFLKDIMIDVGHLAYPVFTDIDFDGDEDLLIGSGKNAEGASLRLYENIGSPTQPSFLLKTTDYLALKQEGYKSIKAQVFDVNKNDFSDLILTIILDGEVKSLVFLHSGNPLEPYVKSNTAVLNLPDMSIWDSPFFYELETQTALFIGKQEGNLVRYTTTGSIISGNWQFVTNTYLDIEEDFSRRNLTVSITDINANGLMDMVTIDDSGEIVVYENFIHEKTPASIKGFDEGIGKPFNLNFGKTANITTANLFGKLEPNLVIGLLTGGVQLLSNTRSTDNNKPVALKVIVYPNPIKSRQIVVQTNKTGIARVLDATGKEVYTGIEINAGTQNKLYLNVLEGIYFLEVVTETEEKKVIRIVVPD